MDVRVRPGDKIRLTTVSSIAATVRARVTILYDNGRYDELTISDFVASTDRLQENRDSGNRAHRLGMVTDCFVTIVSTATKRGQLYVQLFLNDGTANKVCLACNYVYTGKDLSLGEFIEPGPGGGEGSIRSITGTNPALGSNVSETVPTNVLWRLISLFTSNVQVTTSPNIGWRITDGTNVVYDTNRLAQTAGQTEVHNFSEVQQQAQDGTANEQSFPLPAHFYLPEAYIIQTVGADAGTDFAAPQYVVEEWLIL